MKDRTHVSIIEPTSGDEEMNDMPSPDVSRASPAMDTSVEAVPKPKRKSDGTASVRWSIYQAI